MLQLLSELLDRYHDARTFPCFSLRSFQTLMPVKIAVKTPVAAAINNKMNSKFEKLLLNVVYLFGAE